MSTQEDPNWQAEVPQAEGFFELRDDRHGVHAIVRVIACEGGALFVKPPRGRPGHFSLERWTGTAFRWTRWRPIGIPDGMPRLPQGEPPVHESGEQE